VRIVVVDDDASTRRLLTYVLDGDAGTEVVGSAATAEEAAALTEALVPDVVLLDLLLGVQDGRDLLGSLRIAAPDAMLVALTSLPAEEAEGPSLAAGADVFHTKSQALFERLPAQLRADVDAFIPGAG
jgi:DNA-binding NarL/FixJ family response regulator